jgi:hypothetical protein
MKEDVRKNFLVDRDETGREVVFFPETGKKYYVEYIAPRSWRSTWGDIDPASKSLQGSYGKKYAGAILAEESVITKDNGFDEIVEGEGSPYDNINRMHEKWKKENGYV